MTETNKIIEQTERLLAAATPGVWVAIADDGETYAHLDIGGEWASDPTRGEGARILPADAALIAHAPTALRKLIDEVHRLRRQVAKLKFDATTQPNADWERNATPAAPRSSCAQ